MLSAAVAGYRVLQVLGSGAFGQVFLAAPVGLGVERCVAVKLLRPEHAARVQIVQRLRDEARMLALLRHRTIVRVDDLQQLNGHWAVVMEYVDGADVEAIVRVGGAIPPRAAVRIAEEIANGLHAAWSARGPDGAPLRLVHRDVKPSNVRVTPNGEVKLLDFGVARAEFVGREARTLGHGVGTPIYMAMERFEGEDTHSGDVYALGVTLFEALAGVPPGRSAGDADRHPPGRKLVAHWTALETLNPALHGLIAAMLDDDPPARPDARTVARQLAEIGGSLSGERLEEWAERVVPAVAALPPRDVGADDDAVLARPGDMLTASSLAAGVAQATHAPAAASDGGLDPHATDGGAGATGSGVSRAVATLAPASAVSKVPAARRRAGPSSRFLAGASAVAAFAVVVGFASIAAIGYALLPSGLRSAPEPGLAAPAEAAQALPDGLPESPVVAGAAPTPVTSAGGAPAAAEPRDAPPPARRAAAPVAPRAAPLASAVPRAAPDVVPVAAVASAPSPDDVGQVSTSGEITAARLNGSNSSFGPGDVPPGRYTALLTLRDGSTVVLRGVEVRAGRHTKLLCDVGACWASP